MVKLVDESQATSRPQWNKIKLNLDKKLNNNKFKHPNMGIENYTGNLRKALNLPLVETDSDRNFLKYVKKRPRNK